MKHGIPCLQRVPVTLHGYVSKNTGLRRVTPSIVISDSIGTIRSLIVGVSYNQGSSSRAHTRVRPIIGGQRPSRVRKVQQRIDDNVNADDKPQLGSVGTLPMSVREMDNAHLASIAALRHHPARIEVLKRHIMSVDKVSYDDAEITFKKIVTKNAEYNTFLSIPYRIGVLTALSAGYLSFPLVFYLPAAEWFNVNFVTTDVPEPEDVETFLEVGSWVCIHFA
jgi:hypothetical protein